MCVLVFLYRLLAMMIAAVVLRWRMWSGGDLSRRLCASISIVLVGLYVAIVRT